jgi:hypothetical protein
MTTAELEGRSRRTYQPQVGTSNTDGHHVCHKLAPALLLAVLGATTNASHAEVLQQQGKDSRKQVCHQMFVLIHRHTGMRRLINLASCTVGAGSSILFNKPEATLARGMMHAQHSRPVGWSFGCLLTSMNCETCAGSGSQCGMATGGRSHL